MENKLLNLSEEDKAMLLNQLDRWIELSEKNSEMFGASNMEVAMLTCSAIGTAYWNVKQFIEVNS